MAQNESGGSAPITKLSTEIVLHIISYLDFHSHADFAFTCKRIANCSYDLLRRHQDAHRKYSKLSDILPETIPILLKSAIELRDPIPVWHVRSFDIYCARQGWAHWRPLNLRGGVDRTVPALKRNYPDETVDKYLGRLRYRMTDNEIDRVRHEFQHGHDGFMKMQVISLCPRLRDLKFVNCGLRPKTSLSWLSRAISWHRTRETWPPGFWALRHVAVGVQWPEADDHTFVPEPYPLHPSYPLASLLKLPNVDSIYYSACRETDLPGYVHDGINLRGYDGGDSVEQIVEDYNLRPGCSSVKHLFLADFDAVRDNFAKMVIESPRELLSMSFRPVDEMHGYNFFVGSSFGESLDSLMFYNARNWSSPRSEAYVPEGIKSAPRHVCMNVNDLVSNARRGLVGAEADHDSFVQYFVTEVFSARLEVLSLSGAMNGHKLKDCTLPDAVDDATASLIESGDYPHLKAVYLRAMEDGTDNRTLVITDKIWFQKTMAAGERAGVDVYTATNRNPKKHILDIPKAPDQFDVASGPCSGLRPDNFWFSPTTGKWEPVLGCGGCGRCSYCLRVYTKRLWKTIRPELRDE